MMSPVFRSALVVALAVTGLVIAQPAAACSCAPAGTQSEDFAAAKSVFRATVVLVEAPPEGGTQTHFRMLVSKAWKGDVDPLQTMYAGPDLCSRFLEEGEEYLIYTQNGYSNVCDRQKKVADAAADLAALGPGAPPATVSTVTAFRNAQFSGTWFSPTRPGQGLLIQLLPDGRAAVTFFGHLNDNDEQDQTWLVGVGEFSGNNLNVPDVTLTKGLGFGSNFNASSASTSNWGSFSLQFSSSAQTLRFTHQTQLTGSGASFGNGTINEMVRLTGVPSSFVVIDGNL